MDAVEFLKQFNRMCKSYTIGGCKECPAYKYRCGEEFNEQEEDGVRIVEQWAKEHLIKTRRSELLKLFPNTPCYPDGCIDMCPCKVGCLLMDGDDSVCVHYDDDVDCDKCKRDFWLKEID